MIQNREPQGASRGPHRQAALAPGTWWRGYVLGALTVLCIGLLMRGLSQPPPAWAQVPDSGAQRERMIRELATTNKKLTEITKLLKQIRDQGASGAPGKQAGPRGPHRP